VRHAANWLYVLNIDIAQPICLAAHGEESAWRWHARFGHVNMPALRKMSREELVRGLPIIEQVDQLCDACLAGKQRRTPFSQQAQWRAERTLELVHGDMYGSISPATPRGNVYFLLLVDDHSQFMWVTVLASKDRAAEAIREFKQRAEGESGCRLMALRMDRGGEFNSLEFGRHCAEEGVHRQLTASYSPQQNGVIERWNTMVVGAARSMLKAKGLPGWFWGEVVTTAVYLLNRVPCKANGGRTPFELWHGKTPIVQHLKVFGCIMYVKNTVPYLKKLDDRGRKMIFVGYERGSKVHRAYDPVTRRVIVTHDVVFDESGSWDWSGKSEGNVDETGQDYSSFSVEYRGCRCLRLKLQSLKMMGRDLILIVL
jgi:transposase InsO family protein